MPIYEHDHYVGVIRAKLAEHAHVRGYQSILAREARCQKSQLSQALAGKMQLSLDHGAALAEFWELSADETHYFLTLISLARAGSAALERNLRLQLTALREQAKELHQRFRARTIADERRGELEAEYYLNWDWQWLHVLSGLATRQTTASLVERTGLPKAEVERILQSLAELGIVGRREDGWEALEANLHLKKTSALNTAYHLIHRQRAIADLGRKTRQDEAIHFSALLSLDGPAYQEGLEKLRRVLTEIREAAIAAPADRVCAVGIDFYVPPAAAGTSPF